MYLVENYLIGSSGNPFKKSMCKTCSDPKLDTSYSYYDGPNLPGTGIKTCDNLTLVIQKIDNEILKIKQDISQIQQQINQLCQY